MKHPKPPDTEHWERENCSRAHADRKRWREICWDEDHPFEDIPWDMRGPPGPAEGGPPTWRGQKFRHNTGRWADRERYNLYRKMKKEGLTCKEFEFFHLLSYGGYWEKEAHSMGYWRFREEREVRRRLRGDWYC